MRERFGGLWRHPEFLKLWTGQSVSLIGSQVTLLALPLTAVLVLKASAAQMGILGAVQVAPQLVLGLIAGAWADRLRRRPLMIAADVGRALVLAWIPLADALGVLHMEQIYAVAFLTGSLSVFFSAANLAVLPSLVPRESLAEGNSKLATSRSVAQSAGPSLAGILVQIFTAPFAILVDAGSFLISVVSLSFMHLSEEIPHAARRGLWREIGEGLTLVRRNVLLRSLAAWGLNFNLFARLVGTLYVLYVARTLGVSPAALGGIYTVLGVSGILGAVLAGRITERVGFGRSITVCATVAGAGMLLIPFASVSPGGPIPPLVLQQALEGFSVSVLQVSFVTLQQTSAPTQLQGRLAATMSFLFAVAAPIGALLAGVLGAAIGLRPTLIIGAIGMLLATLWVLQPAVRRLREIPTPHEPTPAAP